MELENFLSPIPLIEGQTTDKLLLIHPENSSKKDTTLCDSIDIPSLSNESLRGLNALATSKLAVIIRSGTEEMCDDAEIVAAKALLDRSTQLVQR